MSNKIKYTKNMYQYLSWLLFWEVCDMIGQNNEKLRIDGLLKSLQETLSEDQIKIVKNRARRMGDEYYEFIMDECREECELDDEYEYEGFSKPSVSYNKEFAEIWKQAVRNKQTVKMKYDSSTSGITERLLDPYSTSAPYGVGYCHLRKEERRFRFDRIIYIKLTNNKFEKSNG